jgi:hypothetical protein
MRGAGQLVLGLLLVLIRGGEASAQTGTYAGAVVFAGKPVSGATVWLHYNAGQTAKLVEARSDIQGNFHLRGPNGTEDKAVALIARAADGRIGWRLLGGRGHWQASADDRDFRIELLPVGEARGRLSDSSGKPIAHATVTVSMIQTGEQHGSRTWSLRDAPAPLARLFDASSKDDGTFAVPGVPVGASVYATLTTADYKDLLAAGTAG